MTTVPEFAHGALSRAELRQATRQAQALAVASRAELARSWRTLAAALGELAQQRDPDYQPTGPGFLEAPP